MILTYREARREDVPEVIEMLADDVLGAGREAADPAPYFAAFDAMQAENGNLLIVGEEPGGRVSATYQLTFISGLSLSAARRAQIESVRVAGHLRGQGVGAEMFADAEARARAAGCRLMQLTSNRSRDRALAFYEQLGFKPTHIGFKRYLE